MTSGGSSIPGPKPPAVVASSSVGVAQGNIDTPTDRLEAILDRPTTELLDEAGVVVSSAVEGSKTVGGLGVNLMTVFALVAASPWSWIAMLLLGPARVWGFFYAGVLSVTGTAFGFLISVLVFLVFAAVLFVGWFVISAMF
jgi:hypothetical protein